MTIQIMSDHDKREISEVCYPDYGDRTASPRRVFAEYQETAFLSAEYYGDHGENWVVVMKDGIETERINASSLESITWKS